MQEVRSLTSSTAPPVIGMCGIAYCAGESVPMDELPQMVADGALLERFKRQGFENFARSSISMVEQSVLAARETIRKSGLGRREIDAVVIGTSELRDWDGYPERLSKEILRALDLNNIPVVGIALAGCANFASSLRAARNMIVADGYRNVLVVETNQVRGNMDRLVGTLPSQTPSTIFGDGAVSCMVTVDSAEFDILSMDQVVSIFESDDVTNQAITAKNVAGYRHVIDRTLKAANLAHAQIDCYIANNVNFLMLLGMKNVLGFGHAKSFLDNTQRYGHLWGADNLINLHDYCGENSPPAGTRFMMLSQASSYYAAIVCQKRH